MISKFTASAVVLLSVIALLLISCLKSPADPTPEEDGDSSSASSSSSLGGLPYVDMLLSSANYTNYGLSGSVTVFDTNTGDTNVAVRLSSISDPTGIVIMLTQVGNLFQGTFGFGTAPSMGNILAVSDGDTITAVYSNIYDNSLLSDTASWIGPVGGLGDGDLTAVFPANNAIDAYPEAPLSLTFSSTPIVGGTGKIRIYRLSDHALMDSIDLADSLTMITRIGSNMTTADNIRVVNYHPVIIDGNTAWLFPHHNKLTYDETYYVQVENGVVSGVNFYGVLDTNWIFTTRSAPSPGNPINVSHDGTGDFYTVQAALNHVPVNNVTPITINIANGTYEEMLYLADKRNITLFGEDRSNTVIQYRNSESLNIGSGSHSGPTGTSPVGGRSLFLIENDVSGLVIDNLTINNSTPEGGGQAETIIVRDGTATNVAYKNVNFLSYQDTLQVKGVSWFYNCLVAGDVDFIWGYPEATYFEDCEIRCRNGNGYIVAARCPNSNVGGFVFSNCQITREVTAGTYYLARTPSSGSVYWDIVTYINCEMDTHISPIGWEASIVSAGAYILSEYGTTTIGGGVYDLGSRGNGGVVLGSAAGYDKPSILNGWNPSP